LPAQRVGKITIDFGRGNEVSMYRGLLMFGVALLALVLCVPTSIRASEPEHGGDAKAHDAQAGKAHAEEVDHDLFGEATDLGIWTLAVFLVLLFVLSKFAWKPMMQGLEQRERTIHAALHEAQQAREEAERLRLKLEEQMRHADEQARRLLDEARRAAERTTAEMTAEAQKKIQAEQERLQREMNLAYERARRDLQAQVVQLSTLVAGKAIRRQLNHDDQRQLVEETLAELSQSGNGHQRTARG
jgi:F-type H+-transporting ATPase subunit b